MRERERLLGLLRRVEQSWSEPSRAQYRRDAVADLRTEILGHARRAARAGGTTEAAEREFAGQAEYLRWRWAGVPLHECLIEDRALAGVLVSARIIAAIAGVRALTVEQVAALDAERAGLGCQAAQFAVDGGRPLTYPRPPVPTPGRVRAVWLERDRPDALVRLDAGRDEPAPCHVELSPTAMTITAVAGEVGAVGAVRRYPLPGPAHPIPVNTLLERLAPVAQRVVAGATGDGERVLLDAEAAEDEIVRMIAEGFVPGALLPARQWWTPERLAAAVTADTDDTLLDVLADASVHHAFEQRRLILTDALGVLVRAREDLRRAARR
ncbi:MULTISPECIES: hypothetical protein [Actinosynnema]|uniref:hypothetical protein n=1 Tax=Actinosynnema TaxID=40566 RepID=UPI0020A4D926|nr:hypothetical protein [Actinosynnema pretiosum]MCP2097342.1 hypothetical protein [Actinosynnema pretiosum]